MFSLAVSKRLFSWNTANAHGDFVYFTLNLLCMARRPRTVFSRDFSSSLCSPQARLAWLTGSKSGFFSNHTAVKACLPISEANWKQVLMKRASSRGRDRTVESADSLPGAAANRNTIVTPGIRRQIYLPLIREYQVWISDGLRMA